MENMWSNLPFDMLRLISEGLTVADFARFSSVCRAWHLVYSMTKHSHYDETPWLLYTAHEHKPDTANLYDLSNKKEVKIGGQPGLSLHNRIFIGSAHGWVITVDKKSEVALVNPVTRQQIDLPAVTTFGHFVPAEHDANGEITRYLYTHDNGCEMTYNAEELQHYFYTKATLMHSHGVQDDYTVVIILSIRNCIAFTRCGDKKWTTLPQVDLREGISCNSTEGKVYTILSSGTVESWDFTRDMPEHTAVYFPATPMFAPISCPYPFYLVQTPWGDTLHVLRRIKGPWKCFMTTRIWIYKVDFEKKTLVHIDSIGNYALFVGGNVPLCVSCKNNPSLRPNSVYFTDEDLEKSWSRRRTQRDIGIYSLDDKSVQLIMPKNSLLN